MEERCLQLPLILALTFLPLSPVTSLPHCNPSVQSLPLLLPHRAQLLATSTIQLGLLMLARDNQWTWDEPKEIGPERVITVERLVTFQLIVLILELLVSNELGEWLQSWMKKNDRRFNRVFKDVGTMCDLSNV